MHTVEKLPMKSLPPGCVLPQLKSFFMNEATREAGKALYEILGMAELMRVAYEKGELESLQHRLTMLLSDAADLSATLANVLELSRMETKAAFPVLREFDIVALLQEVAQIARNEVGQKPVTVMDVAAPNPVIVLSDPQKVRQLMTELMRNAVKYTDRGRIALIMIREEESLRLIVTDTGKGMSKEKIAAFFEEEGRFDGEVRAETGGLGIRIVMRLVRSLNGRISVSSKIGEGTIAEVIMPVSHAVPQRTISGRQPQDVVPA